ncbi:MAG: PD-(D/E)XK nuclease family protein [Candidatus Bipolaricaulia bacterium]
MKLRKSLTVDKIYRKVKDYDLVLTAEPSLADALNNRVEAPRLGKLAYTPRKLISRRFQNEDLNGEKELFLELVRETDLTWKMAAHLLARTIDYWQDVGSLDSFSERTKLDREKVEKILPVIKNISNIYREMEDYEIPSDRELCVVGLYQFTGLDRSVLPDSFETLELFTGKEVRLEPFRVFSSANQVVGGTIDNIKRLGPESTAVVVHPDSTYDPLLRSYLKAEEVSFQASEKLQESESLRTLLELLSLSLRPNRLKLKDAEPVFNKMGMGTPKQKEEEYITKSGSPRVEKIRDILHRIADSTFGEVVGIVKQNGLDVNPQLEEVLKGLRLWTKHVSLKRLNDLQYYLDSFSIEIDESDKGVLLVNPGAVAYIDRPVVFYLGMSTKWDTKVDRRPWRDLEKIRRRNLNNFKALLQNGDRQLYMVQNHRMNREVTPTTYFNELQPEEFSSFAGGKEGKDYVLHEITGPEATKFDHTHVNLVPEKVTTVSKTGLNQLVQCPRDYFFSRLVEEPDREYFRKGNVFHEFAEFYANYPEYVKEKDPEYFVDLMVNRMKSIVDDDEVPKLKTEFRLGFQLLKHYLESRDLNVTRLDNSGYSPSEERNYFANQLDRSLERRFTEMIFLNEELGVRGKVDLVTGNELVDYKTGAKKSSSHIVRNSNPELFDEKPDFQALIYLSHHRTVAKRRKLKFTFFHVLEDPGSIIRGDYDLDDFVTSVTYYPWTFDQFLTRDEVFEAANTTNKREKLLEPLGKEKFSEVMSKLNFESEDFYSKDTAEKYRQQLEELFSEYLDIGRGKDVTRNQLEKATGSILRTTLHGLRTENYFKEDVDRFEDFLAETLVQLNKWKKTRFPVGNKDLEKINHRDLILAGEGR